MKSLLLSVSDLKQIVEHVTLDKLVDEMASELEQACCAYKQRRYEIALREGFHYTEPRPGLIEWMPTLEVGRAATIKLVAYHPQNKQHARLPTILSTLFSVDPTSGHLRGVVDGTFLTAVRTAAASVVASRVLARPDSRTLGIIGCGAQAVAHVHAFSRAFKFERVLVFDDNDEVAASFAGRLHGLIPESVSISVAPTNVILAEADILVTATSVALGDGPVCSDGVHQSHLHINAIGSDFPGKRELPVSLLRRALVCPDLKAQATKEGECQALMSDEIGPELVELVCDKKRWISARERLTVFDSTGWALEDHIATEIVFTYAEKLALGTEFELETIGADPQDPYHFMKMEIDDANGPAQSFQVAER